MVTSLARHDALPRPPERRPRPRHVTLLRGLALAAVAAAAGLGLAVRWSPAFYAERLGVQVDRAAARRFLTKVAALHQMAALREAARDTGAWDLALTEAECNAWLADDLPRNHPGLLPPGIAAPRVRLSPGSCQVAAIVTAAAWLPGWLVRPLRPVVTARLDVRLASVGRLECRLGGVWLGVIPLPAGPLVHALADRLRRSGLPCEAPRMDGRSVLVVTLPPGELGVRVAALAINAGEFLVSGTGTERQ